MIYYRQSCIVYSYCIAAVLCICNSGVVRALLFTIQYEPWGVRRGLWAKRKLWHNNSLPIHFGAQTFTMLPSEINFLYVFTII